MSLTTLLVSLPPQSKRRPSERALAVAYLNNNIIQEYSQCKDIRTKSPLYFQPDIKMHLAQM
jgi:hypothetical protein